VVQLLPKVVMGPMLLVSMVSVFLKELVNLLQLQQLRTLLSLTNSPPPNPLLIFQEQATLILGLQEIR